MAITKFRTGKNVNVRNILSPISYMNKWLIKVFDVLTMLILLKLKIYILKSTNKKTYLF